MARGTVWVQCYGTADPRHAEDSTRVLVFPLYGGARQDLWFDQGLHFPHGLVVGLSADKHEHEPLSTVPAGLELRVGYETDTEIARQAAIRALGAPS
ncbi:MAG TPA: hypothetical protein VHB98_18085 [Chloroflexota bacterium]|nr:hypothetical protein [Chloroflexota bacterium]